MHSMVRRFIKTAIGFLFLGLAIGGWLLVRREFAGVIPSPYETSAHTHALFVGFVMMMILGVALWLFPRPAQDDVRYSPAAINVAYWFLTLGTAGRIGGELARVLWSAPMLSIGIVACGAAQVVGIGIFFLTMWTRIRAVGSQLRERQGERF